MRSISTKEFDRLSKLYKLENRCKDDEHDWRKEIDLGHTGDYICMKCYLTVNDGNESEKKKYGI